MVKDEKHRNLLDLSTGERELLDEDGKADLVDLYYVEKKEEKRAARSKKQKEKYKTREGGKERYKVYYDVGGGREKKKVYRNENKEAIYRKSREPAAIEAAKKKWKKKSREPAAIEQRKRRDFERHQDQLEAAHTKNKRKVEFVRKVYETKEPPKKKQLKEATTTTSSSGRKRQAPARFSKA
jgi:hypothetical protein